jgi:hypothetical protein
MFLWCVMKANTGDAMYHGKPIRRGQFATGRNSASEQLDVSPSTWLRIMTKLCEQGRITMETNSHWTTVTVCNYESYQSRVPHERTSDDTSDDTAHDTRLDVSSGQLTIQQSIQHVTQPADTSKNVRTKEVPVPVPCRRFAAQDSTAKIHHKKTLAAIQVEPIDGGQCWNGMALGEIPKDITNRAAVVEWWRKHLRSDRPLTGDTLLDLLQVLCLATQAERKGRKLDKPVAWFSARLADGEWLACSTAAAECYRWLREQIELGRIKIMEGATA